MNRGRYKISPTPLHMIQYIKSHLRSPSDREFWTLACAKGLFSGFYSKEQAHKAATELLGL